MLITARTRAALLLRQQAVPNLAVRRAHSSVPNVSRTNEVPQETPAHDGRVAETPETGERLRMRQAPHRETTWSRGQRPRSDAMVGPRFEQTIMELQPAPEAAIELIHKQPVRFIHARGVECDGGGGPLGHPRIFINLDRPEICTCGYCGLPFANEQHRTYLESLPHTSYPLAAEGDAAEVNLDQRITDGAESGFEQR